MLYPLSYGGCAYSTNTFCHGNILLLGVKEHLSNELHFLFINYFLNQLFLGERHIGRDVPALEPFGQQFLEIFVLDNHVLNLCGSGPDS